MKEKLSQEELHYIRAWLKQDESEQKEMCPFPWSTECGDICEELFPKIGDVPHGFLTRPCPCTIYKPSYVRRKARLLLARNGEYTVRRNREKD